MSETRGESLSRCKSAGKLETKTRYLFIDLSALSLAPDGNDTSCDTENGRRYYVEDKWEHNGQGRLRFAKFVEVNEYTPPTEDKTKEDEEIIMVHSGAYTQKTSPRNGGYSGNTYKKPVPRNTCSCGKLTKDITRVTSKPEANKRKNSTTYTQLYKNKIKLQQQVKPNCSVNKGKPIQNQFSIRITEKRQSVPTIITGNRERSKFSTRQFNSKPLKLSGSSGRVEPNKGKSISTTKSFNKRLTDFYKHIKALDRVLGYAQKRKSETSSQKGSLKCLPVYKSK